MTVDDDSLAVHDKTYEQQLCDLRDEVKDFMNEWFKSKRQVRGSPTSDARRVRSYEKPRPPARNDYRQREAKRDDNHGDDYNRNDNQEILADCRERLRHEKEDCTRCGQQGGHEPTNRCSALNKLCYFCLRFGHLSRCCYRALGNKGQTQAIIDQE